MRTLSSSVSLIICGIAAYFTLHWGIDALLIFTSPVHGLDSRTFAKIVQGAGRMFALGPSGILACAAFYGALKCGVAAIFALYLVNRVFNFAKPDHDLLEAGLVLAVITIGAHAVPLVLDESGIILNQFRVPLWLVGLAATLTMVERAAAGEPAASRAITWARETAAYTGPVPALPRQRGRVSAMRWNLLRQQANVRWRR